MTDTTTCTGSPAAPAEIQNTLTWSDGRWGHEGQPGDYRVCAERRYVVYQLVLYAHPKEIGQAKNLAEAKAIAERHAAVNKQ